jgi:hypothetical protein
MKHPRLAGTYQQDASPLLPLLRPVGALAKSVDWAPWFPICFTASSRNENSTAKKRRIPRRDLALIPICHNPRTEIRRSPEKTRWEGRRRFQRNRGKWYLVFLISVYIHLVQARLYTHSRPHKTRPNMTHVLSVSISYKHGFIHTAGHTKLGPI